MVTIFTGLTHFVLFAAAIGMLGLIVGLIWGDFFDSNRSNEESLMRLLAAACGFLLYIGSKAVGLSIPELAFKALYTSLPLQIALAGVLFPSLIGFFVSWYVVNMLEGADAQKNAVAIRILTMIVVFVFFLYSDSYVASFDSKLGTSFIHLLPNLSFVLSVLFYMIF